MPVEIHIVSTSDRTKDSVGLPNDEDESSSSPGDKKKKQREIIRFIRGSVGDADDLPDVDIIPMVERAVKKGTSDQMAQALEIMRQDKTRIGKDQQKDNKRGSSELQPQSGKSTARRVVETFIKDLSDLGKKVKGDYDREVRRRRGLTDYEDDR